MSAPSPNVTGLSELSALVLLGGSAPKPPLQSLRHDIRYGTTMRALTTDDKARDRNGRSWSALHCNQSHKITPELESFEPSKSFSVYTSRYPSDPNPEGHLAHRNSPPVQSDPDLILKMQKLSTGGTPLRTREPTFNSSLGRRIATAAKVEEMIVTESYNRLDPRIYEVKPCRDKPSPSQAHTLDNLYNSLLRDMQDPTCSLGKLVQSIAKHKNDGKEQTLQDNITEFSNLLTERFVQNSGSSTRSFRASALWKSLGAHSMQDRVEPEGLAVDKSQNKIDILLSGIASEEDVDLRWSHALGFGEIKSSRLYDLRDDLLGQTLRYARKLTENNAASGKLHFFTLCGSRLRLWYTDASHFGSSTVLDFAEPNDYRQIIDIFGFLSGPADDVLQKWQPAANDVLRTRLPGGKTCAFKLDQVKLISWTRQLWGRRTVIWSAKALPIEGNCPLPRDPRMRMIIKSTWLPRHLHEHELDVLRWIKSKEGSTDRTLRPDCHLPSAVGTVLQTGTGGLIDIDDWWSTGRATRNSTIATYCIPAVLLRDDLEPKRRLSIFRQLFESLRYLSSLGVHYRDLNGGNILIDSETGKQCVLIDFGHARILKRRRGMSDDEEELLLISLEDSRSANEYFMSRRIHELTEETKRYQSYIDERQGLERELSEAQSEAQRMDLTSDIARTDASISGSLAKLNHHRLHHHYIDDAESALYVWLYEANQLLPELERDTTILWISTLSKKKEFWDRQIYKAPRKIFGCMNVLIGKLRDKIDLCQSRSESVDPGKPADPLELECFDECIALMKAEEAAL